MRDITALGSPTVLIMTLSAVYGYLMMARQWHMAWLAAGASPPCNISFDLTGSASRIKLVIKPV